MQPLLSYLIKTIICSGILFGYYWFFLRNKGFHSYNRFYLLCLVIVSLLLPLIKIDFWQQQDIESSNVIQLLQAIPGTGENIDGISSTNNNSGFKLEQWLLALYISICFILLLVFASSIYKIWRLIKNNALKNKEGISLITTSANGTPFTFLHFIFWNNNIDIESPTGRQMFLHEMVHVQQKHSYDKLFINLTKAIFWCNPFFWLVKKELAMVHEFVADKLSVDNNDTSAFAAMILQAAYPQQNFQLTNNFFHSPIKRRLTMLTKNNKRVGYISRVAALPLFLLVFAGFTFKTVTQKPLYKGEKTIVVIDAGHGGKDFGAAGGNNVYEKDISLVLAKKVKELNKNENIELILTRETDIYQTPQEKANFVNNKKAGLLISFHADGATKDSAAIKSGISVLVSKDEFSNSKESKVLASAMIEIFNKNYPLPVTQNPVQRQVGIWLLKTAQCPSVLIEAGFVTNKKDLVYLQSTNGQETIAQNILNGIEKYLAASATVKQQ